MNKIIENSDIILENIKTELQKAVIDRNHGFHCPVFSNIDDDHQINSRTIVLRNFNSDPMTIDFNTDIRSPKVESIKKNIQTNFLFYDTKIKTQLRIQSLSNSHYKDDITKDAWNKTKIYSRKCYLTDFSPSSKTTIATDGLPIHLKGKDPSREESENGYKHFVVIRSYIKSIDWLHLHSSGHRRLLISFHKDCVTNQWLIP